ncbi:unnamed protein product [Ectocarpus fasciculatus]
MTYTPTILYKSTGLSESFRYALLVEVVFLVAGVPSQLALYTVLLKWVLAGERGAVHAHARSFCMDMGAGPTLTAGSATLRGEVLRAREVFGGRPSQRLAGNWAS